MIPRAHIIAWQEHAPWIDEAQVEQDLVLSRAIVELFSDPHLCELVALRGGTTLHKLHLAPAVRYSEGLYLVQMEPGLARPIFEQVRARLDPWLGEPRTRAKRNGIQLIYRFATEFPPTRQMKLKIEVNTREHFSVLGFIAKPYRVDNPWFSGSVEAITFPLDEMLGTKLRALYQRTKGRDLFDLWEASRRGTVNADAVTRCFTAYLDHQGLTVSRREFEVNLANKADDSAFRGDVEPLVRPGLEFEFGAALRHVREQLLARL